MPEAQVLTRLEPSERLMSIDALRGFDMFWIVGAEQIVQGLKKLGDSSVVKTISGQLDHKQWEGLAFEDLIFPLFVFLSGVSIAFSLGKSIEQKGRWRTVGKLALRALILFVIGIFYYGGFKNKWPDIRLLGVLQRIAISYFFAGATFCFLGLRGRIAVFLGILIGYWALMTFVPIPNDGVVSRRKPPVTGETASREPIGDVRTADVIDTKPIASATLFPVRFDEGTNLANYIDRHYLPGKRYDWKSKEQLQGDHDPEGILSSLPAIATCLLGVFAGMLLKTPAVAPNHKALLLLSAGVVSISLGYLWGLQFPIIKKLWTSSFVLVAGGWALLFLSVFYYVIDVRKWQKWSLPFVWIGTNALAIYLSETFIDYGNLAKRFVGGDIAASLGVYATLVNALVALGLLLLIANFLYRKKVFIRI